VNAGGAPLSVTLSEEEYQYVLYHPSYHTFSIDDGYGSATGIPYVFPILESGG